MTKVRDIAMFLDSIFPRETAESYDNPGLLAGSLDREVTTAVVTLDAGSEAVEMCRETGAELLISHHPLIFGGIRNVTYDDPNGRILSDIIASGISLFAVHTNLDKNADYSNKVLASVLGDKEGNARELEGTSCGVLFDLPEKKEIDEFYEDVKTALNGSGIITYPGLKGPVGRVFAQGGSFDEDALPYIVQAKADAVVSGEIKHHIALLLKEYGIAPVIAGHRETENVFIPVLAAELKKGFPDVRFLLSL